MAPFYIRINIFFLVLLSANTIFSQKLVITDLKEAEQKLIVTYDILDYSKEDLFDVYVELTTSSGNVVRARSVDGDINKKVVGGQGYKIIWNLVEDSVLIDEDVDIQVNADVTVDLSYFKYPTLMLSSTLLPGAGLKKITRKRPYLLLSLLGYSGIGASIYFYTQGQKAYSDYENESDPVLRQEHYDLANRNNNNATVVGLSSAGIWLINYIWLTTKWNKLRKENASLLNNKLKVYGNYNPVLKKPMLTLLYQF